jgi:hypothetical protein
MDLCEIGKSSIVKRYVDDEFRANYLFTIGGFIYSYYPLFPPKFSRADSLVDSLSFFIISGFRFEEHAVVTNGNREASGNCFFFVFPFMDCFFLLFFSLFLKYSTSLCF